MWEFLDFISDIELIGVGMMFVIIFYAAYRERAGRRPPKGID